MARRGPALATAAAALLFAVLALRGLDWGIVSAPSGRVFFLQPDENANLAAVQALIAQGRVFLPASGGVWPYYLKGLFVYSQLHALASVSGLPVFSRAFGLLGRGWIALQGLLCVLATAWLGRRVFSPAVGAAAALLLAACPGLVAQAHYMSQDVPLALLTTVVLWLAFELRKRPSGAAALALGAAGGLAVATKHSGAVLVLPSALATWKAPPRLRLALTGAFAAALAAADPIVWAAPRTVLVGARMLAENNGHGIAYCAARLPGWLDYAWNVLPYSLGGPLAALGLAALGWLALQKKTRGFSTPALAFFAGYWLLLGFDKFRLVRYTVPLLPLFCLSAAAMLESLWKRGAGGRAAAAVLFAAAFGAAGLDSAAYTGAMARPDPRVQAFLWFFGRTPRPSVIAVPFDDFSRVPTPPGGVVVETKLDWTALEASSAAYFVHSDIDWLEYQEAGAAFPRESGFIRRLESGEAFEKVAVFENPMSWAGWTWRKDRPPHDWLYPDAAITVYRRR